MLRLQRQFYKSRIHYIRRGLSVTSCQQSSPKVNYKSSTSNNSTTSKNPLWSVPFLSKYTDEDEKKKGIKEQDDNAFIASLMSNKAWLSSKIDWPEFPSVDAINAKISELYPQFNTQFIHLREGYEKMWDYLTMEEFRKIVEQVKKEENDINVYPEIARDAVVR